MIEFSWGRREGEWGGIVVGEGWGGGGGRGGYDRRTEYINKACEQNAEQRF